MPPDGQPTYSSRPRCRASRSGLLLPFNGHYRAGTKATLPRGDSVDIVTETSTTCHTTVVTRDEATPWRGEASAKALEIAPDAATAEETRGLMLVAASGMCSHAAALLRGEAKHH